MKSSRKKAIAGLVVVGLILILIDNVSVPGVGRLSRAINNAGHIPLFGVLALGLLFIIRSVWSKSKSHPLACYLMAFAAAGALGAVSELIQYLGPRDADPADWLRDLLGAGVALTLFGSFDSGIRSRVHRISLRVMGLVLLIAGVTPVMFWSAAFYYRNAHKPELCRFDSYFHNRFLTVQDATLEPMADSEAGQWGARLKFGEGPYPGFLIEDVYPDWTPYDSLIIEIRSPLDSSIQIGLVIEDVHNNGDNSDRYLTRPRISAGANRIAVSTSDIKNGPRHRSQDMAQIANLLIYSNSAAKGIELWVSGIRLK